jgi:hypothetical protein
MTMAAKRLGAFVIGVGLFAAGGNVTAQPADRSRENVEWIDIFAGGGRAPAPDAVSTGDTSARARGDDHVLARPTRREPELAGAT